MTHQQRISSGIATPLRAAFFIALTSAPLGAFAQSQISGKVIDGKDNQPIIGAVITLLQRDDTTRVLNTVTPK